MENLSVFHSALFNCVLCALVKRCKERYKLYAKKSDENAIMKKMLDYLDSYIGNNNFHLIVSFKKGVPDIFIIV